MADAARTLGREYLALTDHSPNLTIANGLSAERLTEQLDVVAGHQRRTAATAAASSPASRSTSWRTATLDQTPETAGPAGHRGGQRALEAPLRPGAP